MTPANRQRWLALFAALAGWGIDGVEMGVMPVIARPALSELLASPNEDLIRRWNAGLSIAFLLGAAIGGFVLGRLGDRIGRVKALSISVLVYSLFTGVGAFAQSPWQMAGSRCVASMGMGGEWALGVALVMESWPERYRPWLAGMIGASVNIGYIAVALLAKQLDPGQWRNLLMWCSAPAVLTLFFRLWVPESPAWRRATDRRNTWEPQFASRILYGCLAAGVYILGVWGAVQFTQLWAAQLAGRQSAAIDVQLISAGSAAIGAFAAPPLLAGLSRRTGYSFLCSFAAASSLSLFIGVREYGGAFLALVACVGLSMGAFAGWLALYLPELFPTRIRATGQGTCYNAGRVFAAVGVLATAGIDVDYPTACACVSLVFIVGLVMARWLPETGGHLDD